jgi:hypothetical protein
VQSFQQVSGLIVETQVRGQNWKLSMNTKNNWLRIGILAAILAATGCGGGSPSPRPPILAMNSSSADFGDVAIGTTRTLGVTFSNTGGSSLTLQQNSISGAGFAANGIGAGVTLDPGQFVTLAVIFNPSGSGKANGFVSLTSSTSSSTVTLSLSGNGVVASHSAALGWNASTSAVVGYNIYRNSVLDVSWTRLNSSPVITTSYTDWDVQSGEFYLYSVKSVNAANIESAFSEVTAATVPSP